MTLQSSGPISANNINVELGKLGLGNNAEVQISLNDTDARALAGITGDGTLIRYSDFYGKSNRHTYNVTFTTSHSNATLAIADSITGSYVAGSTDVIVTVNSGVYLWASTTGNNGLTLSGATGDTLLLVNNGFIMGMGGAGGAGTCSDIPVLAGAAGGNAISLGVSCSITNNSYIGGGGGGGGGGYDGYVKYGAGGGGAGGGDGGVGEDCYEYAPITGGVGGTIGSVGGDTSEYNCAANGGGGGGRIFPGVGGIVIYNNGVGIGGGSGGSGGGWICGGGVYGGTGGTGGSAGNPGNLGSNGGGGGGGWGAAGAAGGRGAGGAGGKCVALNGFTVTWVATGTRYGSIS